MKIYKPTCIITALLFFFLFYTLQFEPENLCSDLGLQASEVACLLAKRASILMLGFGVLLTLARNIEEKKCRFVISASLSVCLLGLAYMSGYEFFRGSVSSGIIPPLIIETLIGLIFLTLAFFNIKDKTQTSNRSVERNA